MPDEILISANSASPELDDAHSVATRSVSLAFASLESLSNQTLELQIGDTYRGIYKALYLKISSSEAANLYMINDKYAPVRSVVFQGYLGLDSYVNGKLSVVTELPEDTFLSLKCGINALFCSCKINNLTVSQTSALIYKTLAYYSTAYPIASSQLDSTIFTDADITYILNQKYSLVLASINLNSPKDNQADVYHYSFYDTTKLFTQNINYQKMGDSEVQYYYLSGKLIYDQNDGVVNPCIKDNITGADGLFYDHYRQLPCVDLENSVSPIQGLSFYRKFPDGPNAIGSDDLSKIYDEFNIAADSGLYQYNNIIYTDPSLRNKLGNLTDLQIFPDISASETGQVPQSPNSTGYSSSHIGGSRSRWRITGYQSNGGTPPVITPLYGFVPMTGFKIIPLSLDASVWGDTYNSIRTNPDTSLDLKLIRALNINDHLSAGEVGGPVISNTSFELPCIFLNEEFSNKTIGTNLSGSLYFGTFTNSVPKDGKLSPIVQGKYFSGTELVGGTYSMGDTGNPPKINFTFTIPNTGITGNNSDAAAKCFGMGDGIASSNIIITGETSGNNLGIFYYNFSGISGETLIPGDVIISRFNDGIIGQNGQSSINYIDGFTETLPAKTEKVYAYNQSGQLLIYNYFRPGSTYGGITIPTGNPQPSEGGWSPSWTGAQFPIPNGAENLTPIYVSQRKENYHPRFSKNGPYSSKRTAVLYPSANGVNNLIPTGFPSDLKINLSISEEIARVYIEKIVYRYLDGEVSQQVSRIDSDIINKNTYNFITDLPFAEPTNPQISVQSSTSSEQILVPDYWVNYQFIEYSDSIFKIYSGACKTLTGIINDTISFGPNNAIVFSQNLASGHYVLEYKTGYYQDPNDFYKIQESNANSGFFLNYSNTGRKLDFTSQESSTPDFLIGLSAHDKFYHTGGLFIISGKFGDGYTNTSPIQIRLEKDCGLCEEFYFKYYDPNGSIDKAGCKYLDSQLCKEYYVYPNNTTSTRNARQSSTPTFKQGVRSYQYPYQIGDCLNLGDKGYRYYEVIKIKTGPGSGDYLLKEMPLFDIDTELHYQTGKNVDVNLKYALPEFNINDRQSHAEYADEAIQSFIPLCDNLSTTGSPISLIAASNGTHNIPNKGEVSIIDGVDPIWFERVGGNSGISGGYHSKNLVGDGWIGLYADNYGIRVNNCPPEGQPYWTRNPEDDNYVIVVNNRLGSEFALHTRALGLTPGYYDDRDGNYTYYDLTGMEKYNSFENLSYDLDSILSLSSSNGFEQYSYLYSDYLYPIPTSFGDDGNLNAIKYTGANNAILSKGISQYWKDYLMSQANPSLRVTGYKYVDKSRLNFRVNTVSKTNYGPQPVQLNGAFKLVGNCIVSGEFGYHSQAESAVYTEGVFLKDHSNPTDIAEFYLPSFVSDIMFRSPLVESGTALSPLESAPSKCVTRQNISQISNAGNVYVSHLTNAPYNYNKFIVPALSDLSLLNDGKPEVGFEKVLANDGSIFPNATFLLSASVAQHKDTAYDGFVEVPNAPKVYYIQDSRQFYDSSVTDAAVNSGYFMDTGRGTKVNLTQVYDASGFLGPIDAKYSLFKLGIYKADQYEDYV